MDTQYDRVVRGKLIVVYLRSRCFSAASTRKKFSIEASCGFNPSACSLGIRSALIRL